MLSWESNGGDVITTSHLLRFCDPHYKETFTNLIYLSHLIYFFLFILSYFYKILRNSAGGGGAILFVVEFDCGMSLSSSGLRLPADDSYIYLHCSYSQR